MYMYNVHEILEQYDKIKQTSIRLRNSCGQFPKIPFLIDLVLDNYKGSSVDFKLL